MYARIYWSRYNHSPPFFKIQMLVEGELKFLAAGRKAEARADILVAVQLLFSLLRVSCASLTSRSVHGQIVRMI